MFHILGASALSFFRGDGTAHAKKRLSIHDRVHKYTHLVLISQHAHSKICGAVATQAVTNKTKKILQLRIWRIELDVRCLSIVLIIDLFLKF